YATTGATGATFIGLPTGVSGSWAGNVVTISGTPVVSGAFPYTITLTGGCGNITANGTITVNPDHTISLTSVPSTTSQTVCINTPISNITYSVGGGATGATATGLPSGVTGTFSGSTFTISSTPTASGTFNYSVTTTGNSCVVATANGTITVNPDHTINLTSAPSTSTQTVCINTAIAGITYSVGGGATGASVSGLPAGVSGTFIGSTLTISGTPTVSGTFNYSVTTTGNSCIVATATGTITVNPDHTINLTSAPSTSTQSVCINTAINGITYSIGGGATGATVTGLPSGVTGTFSGSTFTISGTPTASGTFNYSVTTTGNSCVVATANGTITVNPNHTISLTSANNTQTVCINKPIANITYSVGGGATGATVTGLPSGVTGTFSGSTFSISGTPTASGTFNYSVTTTGNSCVVATANGTITVNPNHTISLTSAPSTTSQTVCFNTPIANITYSVGGGATGATVTGLPSGVTGTFSGSTFTISGTPTASGIFNYSVTTTGNSCVVATANGSITVQSTPTAGSISSNQKICPNSVPSAFSSSAGTGSGTITYIWEKSIDGGTTWSVISGATSATYASPALSQTTRFRRTTVSTLNGVVCNSVPTASVEVIVLDDTPPIFTAPSPITVYVTAACSASINPSVTGTVTDKSDNCTPSANLIVNYTDGSPVPGSCTGTYSVTRTWTVTDAYGNTSLPKTQLITVADNIKPTLNLPSNKTIECSASTHPDNTGWPTGSDNCAGSVTFTYTDVTTPGSCTGRSTITRTWTAKDCSENTTTGTQIITIVDTKPPVLTCNNFSVANSNAIPASDQNVNITAVDACSGNAQIILTYEEYTGLTQGAGFCPSSVIRKYVARDACGNQSDTCTQVITVIDNTYCPICQDNVPYYPALLNGAPDSLWISPLHKREGICCGATGPPPPRCTSFNVYLDKDAVGLIFNIESGAVPPGALYYQVDCGTPVKVGDAICLAGGRFYTLTFCKPGNNKNTYSIQSISGLIGGAITTRQDAKCATTLSVTGAVPGSIVWSVKSPNDQSLLRYLSCTNCANPVFTPDSLTPPVIVYQFCGAVEGQSCNNNPIIDCSEFTVTTLPKIDIQFNIDPGNICANNIPTINANITPINLTYTYQWFSGPNGSGTLLSTNPSWKPQVEGDYSLVVTETQSGVKCNTATHNFSVRFDRLGPNSLVVPSPLVVQCNAPGAAQQIANWRASATAMDGTVPVPVTDNYTGINMACNQPPLTVTFRASDQCGNVSSATSTITVIDTVPPVWLTVAGTLNRSVDCSDNIGLNAARALEPIATDLCDPTPTLTKTSGVFVPGSCPNSGTYTNTWTARDNCNNVSTVFTQVITVYDDTPPAITTQAQNLTVECDGTGNTAALNSWLANHAGAVASDDCSTVTWSNNYTGLSDLCGATGAVNVIFTAKDACGNSSTTQATFTIVDTQGPAITCPANVTGTTDQNECYATGITMGTATANDNCSASGEITITNNAPAQFPLGTTTVTWTATDACGNSSTCNQTVTITDNNQPPTITCPADVVQTAPLGSCALTNVTIPDPVAADNCGVVLQTWTIQKPNGSIISSPATGINSVSGQTFDVGVSVVTYTVKDASGHSASCSFNVWIKDLNKPVFTSGCPPDITKNADPGLCSANVTVPVPTVSDPCNEGYTLVNSITGTNNASGVYPVGVTTVIWTITDASGNVTTCTQTITVNANPPVITCPPNATVNCTDPTTPEAFGFATATDPCDPAPAISYNDAITPGSCASNYTIRRTWTAVNKYGKSAGCVQVITITPPTFTMPTAGASTVACISDAQTVPANPTVNNSCGAPLTVTGPVVGADPVCSGTKTYTWTYTDCTGISAEWVYTYTIDAPVVTMPSNPAAVHVACAANATAPVPPVVTDNCGRTLAVSAGVPSADPICSGDKTWTFTYTDCANATYSWVYTYTIDAPVVTMPSNPAAVHVACAANATAPVPPVVTDNCGRTLAVSAGVPSADPICSGDKTWTFTYTDCANATYSWVYTYTIDAPVVTMPSDGSSTVNCPADALQPTAPVVKDACDNVLTPTITTPSLISCDGSMTYVFTYKDCSGHSHYWSYVYTIAQPDFTLPANVSDTVNCPADAVRPTAPVVKDACGNILTPTVSEPSLISCDGSMTYVFTYKDCSGHTHAWSYVYTIAQPDFTLPASGDSTVNCPADAVRPTAPEVKDACGNILTPTV
ncbi:HYR domain-containing protein, partial [Parabacteroides sp. FAFU027]|uniref:HYR-like domain-containing protein n=1 Tax=Parabacteroides sp. FAFU027 TaxID=2922715 RepID=UPI001FAF4E34